MKGIGISALSLIISIGIVGAQALPQMIVQPATAPTTDPTPVRPPVGTLKPHPTEITVEAANSSVPQPTAQPSASSIATEKAATLNNPGTAQGKESDAIPRDQAMALAKRIQEQQIEIEANQVEIDEQAYDIFVMVDQAFFFSRRASK